MLRLLIFCTALYVVLLLFLFVKQRSLIFQPDNYPFAINTAEWLVTPVSWPSEENRYGYLIEPDDPVGTIIVFHGNAGQALHRAYYANVLAAQNYRVILAEYPGYGGRPGKPSETVLVDNGRQLVTEAARTFPDTPIHLLGESMGSGVVSAIVSQKWQPTPTQHIVSIILITPFDSLAAVAQTHYWYIPAKLMVRDKFDNIKNLQKFNGMKQVILAGRDTVVPIQHGEELYKHLHPSKRRYVFETANHSDWIEHVDLDWWQIIMSTANGEIPN